MPELPEVEIVCRGVADAFVGHRLTGVIRRFDRLRWPIPADLDRLIGGGPPGRPPAELLRSVTRRSKYLLLGFDRGTLLIHLGMSGTLRRLPAATLVRPHDHVDLVFGDSVLRFNDPRRFGALLWSPDDIATTLTRHPLLRDLGVEPFSPAFDADLLHRATRGRRTSIKQVLLSGLPVVGVGNIYASESLFRAAIRPTLAAGRLNRAACERLVPAVRATLAEAIDAGGSSLRDFVASSGAAGYFQLRCAVYGRGGEPCRVCATAVRMVRQQARASFYCPSCQPAIGRLPSIGRRPPRIG
ncbi:MAG: bifunctional DNA-formamidopyrimidine glycosylase/DNA-(apurinic or apyrimidinic site) lyase [Lautropia sp.]